jgi:RNA polymerase sigma factor (sigma-70 family)
MGPIDDDLHELIEQNAGLAWAVANKWRRSGLDVDDLAQHGMIGLMKAAEGFNPERGQFSTHGTWWARSVIGRAAEKLLRHEGLASLDALEQDPQDDAGGPFDVLDDAEQSERLWAAVDCLLARDRMVIELRFRDGFSQLRVAEFLEISRARVHQLERRGVERLREMLAAG